MRLTRATIVERTARAIQNIYRLYKKINDLLNIKAIYTVSGINQNRFSGGSEYDYV